jgi:hypothetical protein
MCNTKMTFKEFDRFIDDNTDNFKFIVYNNASQSKEIGNKRFNVVKAKMLEVKLKKDKN